MLKVVREKIYVYITFKGAKIRLSLTFWYKLWNPEDNGMSSLKFWKNVIPNPKFYTHKISIRKGCEINTLSDKQKQREFAANRSIVQKKL